MKYHYLLNTIPKRTYTLVHLHTGLFFYYVGIEIEPSRSQTFINNSYRQLENSELYVRMTVHL